MSDMYPTSPDFKKYTILIVDDNATNLGVIVDYLAGYGFQIMVARNGKMALKRAKFAPPDLILLDVRMPGIDGFETCRLLKADRRTKDIPVIFMTALTSTEDKVQGFAVGAVDYVTKPIQHEEVLARITTHLTLRDLQKQLQQANQELESANNRLEQRVADRTYRLQVMAQLSRQLNQIGDLDYLITTLVQGLQNSFAYYHVQVYLVEPESRAHALRAGRHAGQDLILARASQEIGHKFELYRLSKEQGIVGEVAKTNHYFLSNNVTECVTFVPNPLLPHTKSELALPLRLGDELIGVLDIHSEQLNYFTSKDVSMLQSIADGVAIAINNTRLLSEREATITKWQELDRAKSQFLGVVSHELRTPMNAILGFSEMLLEGVFGELPQPVQKRVKAILTRGEHMVELINNLLDLTQMEAGHLAVHLAPITDIREVIDEVIVTLKTQVGKKAIEIMIDLPADLPDVYADKKRLHQILLNLGSNAIKFTLKGKVTIQVRVDEPDKMRFSVIDTGVGIPGHMQALIFDAFKMVDMSNTRKQGGLGLGLAICKQLVHMQQGEIGLKSKEGVGSEFYFTIPLAVQEG